MYNTSYLVPRIANQSENLTSEVIFDPNVMFDVTAEAIRFSKLSTGKSDFKQKCSPFLASFSGTWVSFICFFQFLGKMECFQSIFQKLDKHFYFPIWKMFSDHFQFSKIWKLQLNEANFPLPLSGLIRFVPTISRGKPLLMVENLHLPIRNFN